MSKEIIAQVRDIYFSYKIRKGFLGYNEHTALNGVSFDLRKGEILGVIGKNGCGKSTLLRIIAGLIMQTSGEVIFKKGIRCALLSLGLGFRPDLSGRDNALLSLMMQGFRKKKALRLLSGINSFAELGGYFDQPVKTYSTGMRSRLGFATAITADVDLLLIDETLAVGDLHFKKKAETTLKEKIKKDNITVVLVSHALPQVENLCNNAIWLDKGLVKSEGDPRLVVTEYKENDKIMGNSLKVTK